MQQIKECFAYLIECAKKKGFLLFSDIFDISQKFKLEISAVDYLTSALLERNIIIQEKDVSSVAKKETCKNLFDETEFEDFAQLDYDKVFSEIKKLSPIQEYFVNYVKQIIPPQRNEIKTLQYQVLEGNLYARKRMIEMHLRQALKMALYFCKTYEQSIDDMISLTCEGLIRAVDNYKANHKEAFISYASLWMMQICSKGLLTKTCLICYPAYIMELYKKLFKNKQNYCYENITFLDKKSIKNISELLCCSEKMTYKIISAFWAFENLDDVYDEQADEFRVKTVKEYDFCEIDYNFNEKMIVELENRSLKQELDLILNTLPPSECNVIKMRFGLTKGGFMTLEEVGAYYNVTRERIRQIEAKALRRLRHPRRAEILREWL
ncbi:MAG: sigma-70 family RNA polymerase sigma factor [Treponema sp.]|nr:sigma-70 family RNA polymerase sigma factor [Treponema sp.]